MVQLAEAKSSDVVRTQMWALIHSVLGRRMHGPESPLAHGRHRAFVVCYHHTPWSTLPKSCYFWNSNGYCQAPTQQLASPSFSWMWPFPSVMIALQPEKLLNWPSPTWPWRYIESEDLPRPVAFRAQHLYVVLPDHMVGFLSTTFCYISLWCFKVGKE